MVAVDELRAAMARKGLSGKKVAEYLGISQKTFYRRMHTGVFMSTEMNALIELLDIENPGAIFFAGKVT